ncbi:serine/threonine-protein kinase ATM isoform X2 [Aristolochia californica]|uniref:serine/threonine-protein kinase ATM isoform X2 n=1 Tax=Aristolochia californica TaxID=171875 RepID=UPI0035DFE8E9
MSAKDIEEDIEEVIAKISSEKVKNREDGVKLLNCLIQGERSVAFCSLLSKNTASLKQNEIPHAETWPFILTLLTKCISLEISASKRRLPKLIFAKTLRTVVQRVEDVKVSGQTLLLLSVIKALFNHIWDVIRDVPSFQSEYGIILRHLMTVKEYSFHIRKRVYCSLVLLYMSKIETTMCEIRSTHSNTKEETFRCMLTLHSLLENPPGDFPDNIRNDVVKKFIGIFSNVRDEGKITRKLIECVNTFLLQEGPNLGCQVVEIHNALQELVFRFWLITHDRIFKTSLILYAKIQLKLRRSTADVAPLLEQLLDVVGKELDQCSNSTVGTLWDDKGGNLASIQHGLMDLAASVIYLACGNTYKAPPTDKRLKREKTCARLKEALAKGKWLWYGAFCFLIQNYHSRVSDIILIDCFEGICENFERILNDGNKLHAYDGLIWVLRSLHELSLVLLLYTSKGDDSQCLAVASSESEGGWYTIWSCLMHWLPVFTNVATLADAALVLLGNIILNDLVNVPIVPQDVWDLRIFTNNPSVSVLFFIACYFSRVGCQGDIRDILYLRQHLVKAVLRSLSLKNSSFLDDRMLILLPAAIFSLCAGCASIPHSSMSFSMLLPYFCVPEIEDKLMAMRKNQGLSHELFECLVEVLAEVEPRPNAEVPQNVCHHNLRLPWQLMNPLICELEEHFVAVLTSSWNVQTMPLTDIFPLCTLLSNCIYNLAITRIRDEQSKLLENILQHLLQLLEQSVFLLEENQNHLLRHGHLGPPGILDSIVPSLVSIRSFTCSLLFKTWPNNSMIRDKFSGSFTPIFNRLLLALSKLFDEVSTCAYIFESEELFPPVRPSPQDSSFVNDVEVRIVDVDLDMGVDVKDTGTVASRQGISGNSVSLVQLKQDFVSAISSFVLVLPNITWNTLFDLMVKEHDLKVHESIFQKLCECFTCSSSGRLGDLVNAISNLTEMSTSPKCSCLTVLTSICNLLNTLVSSGSDGNDDRVEQFFGGKGFDQTLSTLGEFINKVPEISVLDWRARVQLIDCICCYVSLDPCFSTMYERLLEMFQDTDHRVRLFLARRIGVLFQTLDGHEDLFKDICRNFGVKIVLALKENPVMATEVVAAGAQSVPFLETAVVTLVHVALVSEEVELQAIFTMCSVAAISPALRELVYAAFDNLAKRLHYASRTKYLKELMGSIFSYWVACDVSLVSLVEIRDLFLTDSEPRSFFEYCCPWLLPSLILNGKISDLKLISTVTSQTLTAILKNHFVPIFAICVALHCSNESNKDTGSVVLRSTILQMAEISEHERDILIKQNMVSIVSCLLSLTSSASDPSMPFFSVKTIVLAIRTVVDGFLEIDEHATCNGVVDKIQIFRPDRVFRFLIEIHHQITSAVHPRHMCHRLSAVEALIILIGQRAAIPSTSCYLFNLVGQLIGTKVLQDQCCLILSTLLEVFKDNRNIDVASVLGQQLQSLVSKLVASCLPLKDYGDVPCAVSSRVMDLLHQLTVDADVCLHDCVKELEPFPELDCFQRIRTFYEEVGHKYSPKEHFLKFVQRAHNLPHRLLIWSLRALHKKLLRGNIIQVKKNTEEFETWCCEPEIVSAVWMLVGMNGSDDTRGIRELVADFISMVGIADPHRVVFHLPEDSNQTSPLPLLSYEADVGVSDELLVRLIKLLKKYLMDDSVMIVSVTSGVLCGILSTERGRGALLSFNSFERGLLEVHSKAVNLELVEKLLLDAKNKAIAESFSLEDASIWRTNGKTYEKWVCSLTHKLICHTNDMILRLCQEVVLLKAEVAELLFPVILVNLAGRKDLSSELYQLISSQVQGNIFTESNQLIKSIQLILGALNVLRVSHVTKRETTSTPSKRGSIKTTRISSGNARSRYISGRSKDTSVPANKVMTSGLKVYWLPIDYLLVAEAAIRCGSYFTAMLYVEHWCEEHFGGLTLGHPNFTHIELVPPHVELLIVAVTQINEPDSLYGIVQSHKLESQVITYEHEGNWNKALESYDLLVRRKERLYGRSDNLFNIQSQGAQGLVSPKDKKGIGNWNSYKGLMRSLQQIGCTHILDVYCQGLAAQKGQYLHESEFTELQYEAAWRTGNWDFSSLYAETDSPHVNRHVNSVHFHENLHSCLRALQEGDSNEFHAKLMDSKQDLVLSLSLASKESTETIHSSIVRLQILDHLGIAWDLRWKSNSYQDLKLVPGFQKFEPAIPNMPQLERLNADWSFILKQTQLHFNLLEPFIAFRRVLLQILSCKDCTVQHLLKSASALRKGSRFSLAAAVLQELKLLPTGTETQQVDSYICSLGRLEEAKLLWAQGQHDMAINLANYILDNYELKDQASNARRMVGKWLAETRSSNSKIILEKYLKRAVELSEQNTSADKKNIARRCQSYFHLAHYADALFRSNEERLASGEWQAALRLRRHKTKELEALFRRIKSSSKNEKTDYSAKIVELQKQLAMDKEEADRLKNDRDNFLNLSLEGYQRCLVIGDKYDLQGVFRLVSLWFSLSNMENVINSMLSAVREVQSYKFIPLVYQIASRMGSSKEGIGPENFQFAVVSLVKKMAIDHPYHTIFQLLALANGDRIKDKQQSRNSFVVDMDKKLAADNLLNELSSHHGARIRQMKQLVEIYIKLAELETRREDTNKRIALPREIRSIQQLELVPVVTATIQVDQSCQYPEGSFPHFKGIADSVLVMNGINAPKVVECIGSDGCTYRQLAKSGNDDLRQDAVMEQFFGLVNTFLRNNCDTWKRRLAIRTYKVVPFTPSAGVLEWVDRTIPLGEYLLGSKKDGGAHGRYRIGDWPFSQCREYMTNGKDKREAFQEVCENFRPVMHYFFLERYLQPADWFENRLSYTRSVAASSMVGYIVGLGDRHSNNILIDQASAEVVHIDLGVAFDQGLMLKTPERVPFRLTRDIVDGMGVTGVEGVYRKCCEKTLYVMRANKEALLTIIEVFIHDPLYKWALSPLKALQRQKETADNISSLEDSQDIYEGNKDAARALMRVKQKLDGYEEGEMRSVEGQVQRLIQNAVDTERLSQMYPGWGPWM